MHPPHIPLLWRYRILKALGAKNNFANRRLLRAWAKAEGGTARYNPLNTTEGWPGATDYNSAGVKNYPTGSAGVHATVATLVNGFYKGIVTDLRVGEKTARQIVEHNASEFDTWGTGASHILALL